MDSPVSRQWDGKSRGGRWGYKFFVYAIRFLGIDAAYCLLAVVALYFIPFAPASTKAIWKYNRLRRKLGWWKSVRELYCHYFVFGQTLIDKVAMRGGMSERYKYEFDNYEEFLATLNEGTAVVMFGAHVGCWEAGESFFGVHGKRLNIVMVDAEHRQIKAVLKENAVAEDNFKVIAVNEDPIAAMLQIKVALNKGEYVCFNADRYVDKSQTYVSELLGGTVLLPQGPFKIAAKCRTPLVFYYAMREKGKTYRFIFEKCDNAAGLGPEELVCRYVRSLENILEKYPRQWWNFYDFWDIN